MLVVGWNEYVSLPDWGIDRIRAKIDTGAKSSAIHVENLVRGRGRATFDTFCLTPRGRRRRVRVQAPVLRSTRVRSSSGHSSIRCFTRVRLVIGPVRRTIEIGLVDRSDMNFRMLLGRSALKGLLVDASRGRLLEAR